MALKGLWKNIECGKMASVCRRSGSRLDTHLFFHALDAVLEAWSRHLVQALEPEQWEAFSQRAEALTRLIGQLELDIPDAHDPAVNPVADAYALLLIVHTLLELYVHPDGEEPHHHDDEDELDGLR